VDIDVPDREGAMELVKNDPYFNITHYGYTASAICYSNGVY